MKTGRSLYLFGFLSIAMALAPFTPEPHLWGKLKWISGGAVGMGFMDWFDVVVHGGPLFLFLFMVGRQIGERRVKK